MAFDYTIVEGQLIKFQNIIKLCLRWERTFDQSDRRFASSSTLIIFECNCKKISLTIFTNDKH